MRWSRIAVGWFVMLASATAAAQGAPPREPTFARVVDLRGEPIAGAVVTFVGCLPELGDVDDFTDELQVATDKRGRAVARLRSDLCYLAWAVAERQEGALVSAPFGWFGAGAMFELGCFAAPAPRRVQLRGLDAFAAAGKPRVTVCTPSPGPEVEVDVVDGAFEVPPGPFDRVRLLDAERRLLWSSGLPSTGDAALDLPPPAGLALTVARSDGEAGEVPIAGAEVALADAAATSWSLQAGFAAPRGRRGFGLTDAGGIATATTAGGVPPGLLQVAAPGFALGLGGVRGAWHFVDGRIEVEDRAGTWPFRLEPAESLRGRVPGAPRGTIACLRCAAWLSGVKALEPFACFAPVAADGTFAFDGVPAAGPVFTLSLLPPPDAEWLAALWPPLDHRELPAGVAPAATEWPCTRVRLRVVDIDGSPARGGVVMIWADGIESREARHARVLRSLDGRGEIVLALAQGDWQVAAISASGLFGRKLDTREVVQEHVLQLAPFCRHEVRLVDAAGAPIAGARLVRETATVRGSGQDVDVVAPLHRQWVSRWQHLCTDADGRVTIPFAAPKFASHTLRLCWPGGRTAPFELVDGAVLEVGPEP